MLDEAVKSCIASGKVRGTLRGLRTQLKWEKALLRQDKRAHQKCVSELRRLAADNRSYQSNVLLREFRVGHERDCREREVELSAKIERHEAFILELRCRAYALTTQLFVQEQWQDLLKEWKRLIKARKTRRRTVLAIHMRGDCGSLRSLRWRGCSRAS
jgi:hypothetical protein